MTLSAWLGLLAAGVLVSIAPGPGAAISISSGMRYGFRAAFVAILGLQVAILIHLSIVALGLGALLAASEVAFAAVKFCGAAYLVWLGVQKWRAPAVPLDGEAGRVRAGGFFLQGVAVNLTNPKAIVFIAALVPHFIDTGAPQAPQYLLIALTLCVVDVAVMSTYALAAERLGRWFSDPAALRVQNRLFGSIFVGAGVALAGATPSP